MKEATKQQKEFYKKRIGQSFGILEVSNVTYDSEERIQRWTMKCKECGHERVIRKPKLRDAPTTCKCQDEKRRNSKPNKEHIYNDDPSYQGKTYGIYKVIGFTRNTGNNIRWICECVKCGRVANRVPSRLKSGDYPLCVCEFRTRQLKYDASYIGRKFNRLTIIGFGKENNFICQCECGAIKEIISKTVITGKVKSCGCLASEISENAVSDSPLYGVWQNMKQRCCNKNDENYKNYGSRGITVCDEWMNDFKAFEEWGIKNGYRPNCGLSLDRIENSGNYEPDNCRFTSVFVQNVNKRPRKGRFEVDGVFKTKKAWCEEYGVWQATVDYRMKKMGMSFKEALTAEKAREGNHHPVLLDIQRERKQALESLNKINSFIECNLYMAFCRTTTEYELIPQYKVLNYKADFLVKNTNLIIECDGYDQHKTKEQMTEDCKRQRDIENEGYFVIRFTGSEINKSPESCVAEILKRLEKITQIA